MIKIKLPKYINEILEILNSNNYEAYLVGGCVRDHFLNRKINDYDITTSAKPEESIAIFSSLNYKVLTTGIKHGTITVIKDYKSVEITTYRIDGQYLNNRSPSYIKYTDSLKLDLKRRDFTINALAYHPKTGVIDYYNGLEDLKNHVIRAIDNPTVRFNEDALRILRCIRFSLQLDFTIDLNTSIGIQNTYYLLKNISMERIQDEFNKILCSDKDDILILLRRYHILELLIPEFETTYEYNQNTKWHNYDLFNHVNIALNNTKGQSLIVKLSVLLHDLGKPSTRVTDDRNVSHYGGHAIKGAIIANDILRNFRYSNELRKQVITIIKYHDNYLSVDRRPLRKLLASVNNDFDTCNKILQVQIADNKAKNILLVNDKINDLHHSVRLLNEMYKDDDYYYLKDLAITGSELTSFGIENNNITNTLIYLYNQVLHNPGYNTYERLISLVILKQGHTNKKISNN